MTLAERLKSAHPLDLLMLACLAASMLGLLLPVLHVTPAIGEAFTLAAWEDLTIALLSTVYIYPLLAWFGGQQLRRSAAFLAAAPPFFFSLAVGSWLQKTGEMTVLPGTWVLLSLQTASALLLLAHTSRRS